MVSDCTTQRLRACARPSLCATWSQNNTHTAIKDDNSTVQTGNFGHRSAILLAFIGSYQWRLKCINTEGWTQSVSQESHIKDHWGKLTDFHQAGCASGSEGILICNIYASWLMSLCHRLWRSWFRRLKYCVWYKKGLCQLAKK